ncbi:MAG: UDP-N-acetylmuramoyl-tripeptide--D-alanyl-D-alanine ligase [Actinomycetota bacterium]
MKFTASAIAVATNGRRHGPEVTVDGASQDSRAIEPGQLFVPVVAERDGHDFIAAARANGALAHLTHRGPGTADGGPDLGTAIVVDDTMAALRDLGVAARARTQGPVVAITGSVGKTSTKDLLAGALRPAMATHASVKSFNNELGVPLTLLNAPEGTEATVIEMGSRGIGHIAELCAVAAPTVGIVTTVAAAHTGEFGSVDNIAVAKGELVEALPADGLAVLNHDNPLVSAMASRTQAAVLTFGTEPGASVRVRSIDLDDELRATFVIDTEWGVVTARPPTRGAHMATNTAAAVGTALWLGATVAQVEEGVAASTTSPWRMEVGRARSGALVINDSYNANPTSMRGALDSLAALGHTRKIAVVGYMAELGPGEGDDHRRIAAHVRAIGAELVAVGTDLYGADPVDDPLAAIGVTDEHTAILVKGSRSAGLETVAAAICEHGTPAAGG